MVHGPHPYSFPALALRVASQRCPYPPGRHRHYSKFLWDGKGKGYHLMKKGGEKVARLTWLASVARYTIKLSKA